MKIDKVDTEFGKHVFLEEDGQRLCMMFCGNLDLYWALYSSNVEEYNEFVITKENYEIYHQFEILFNDIENMDIHGENQLPFYIKNKKEKKIYYGERYEEIKEKEKLYKKHNFGNYNRLYNKKEKTITWYSDETNYRVSNYLIIQKQKDSFKIVFNYQQPIDDYDRDFHTKRSIAVRFRNSGSYYEPFNIIFMRMYHNMQEIEENDHQMDIEEYLYQKKKVNVKKTYNKADK